MPGKLAVVAKAGALLTVVGLAGAGAATLSGLTPPTPVIAHLDGAPSDPVVTPSQMSPGQQGAPGGGRVPVPEPPSFALVIVAGAGVLAAKWLARGKAG